MKKLGSLVSLVGLSAIPLFVFSSCGWLACNQPDKAGVASSYYEADSECEDHCSEDPGCSRYTGTYDNYSGAYTCSCSD